MHKQKIYFELSESECTIIYEALDFFDAEIIEFGLDVPAATASRVHSTLAKLESLDLSQNAKFPLTANEMAVAVTAMLFILDYLHSNEDAEEHLTEILTDASAVQALIQKISTAYGFSMPS